MISQIEEVLEETFLFEYEIWLDNLAEKQPIWQEETYVSEQGSKDDKYVDEAPLKIRGRQT